MKDEISRITQLIAEGKLTPEDGAELIEAFVAADQADARSSPPPKDSMKEVFENIEDTVNGFDWKGMSEGVEANVKKGFEAIRGSFEDLTKGKIPFGFVGKEERREVRMPLEVAAHKRLRIENPCGSVRVLGRAESGTLLAEARVRGGTPEEAKRRAQEYAPIVDEGESLVVLRQPDVPGLAVDLVVRLVEGVALDVRTEAGDVTVLDHPAGVRIVTRAGSVRATGARGPVEITVDSGEIRLEDVESPSVALESKSGALALTRVRGNVNARTASGAVSIRDGAGGVLSLENVSGAVEVALAEPVRGNVNVRTVSGSVTLDIPEESDCRVSLSSLRGEVDSFLPLEELSEAEGRITGRLGDGTGQIDVSAVTGNVRLRTRTKGDA